MLVRDCRPGDVVETKGFDVLPAVGNNSPAEMIKTAYLVPYRGNLGEAIDIGFTRTMLYVGPVYTLREPVGRHKVHHFLTDDGDSIGLHGSEFKFLSPCKE